MPRDAFEVHTDVAEPANSPQGATEEHGLCLVRFDDMRPRLGESYLIKRLLVSTAMAVVYGEAGTGKTYLAIWLSLCVASGTPFFGHRVRRCGVVYVAAEAGRGIENRIAAAKHEFEFPEIMPFAAITSPIDMRSDGADLSRLVAAVRSAELGAPVALVVIDTLSRVMAGGNENAPDDMGALVSNLDRLRDETGAAVLVVHHAGKDAGRGARGHSLLRAATDTEIEVVRDDLSKIATARVTKQRDLPTEGAICFSLRAVELGVDEDGEPVTSCVVEPAEQPAAAVHEQRLSASQRRALDLLADAIDKAGEAPPASNHIPPNVRCVGEDLWRRYAYQGGISSGDPAAQQKAFKRAAEALVAAGRVGKWGSLVWLV